MMLMGYQLGQVSSQTVMGYQMWVWFQTWNDGVLVRNGGIPGMDGIPDAGGVPDMMLIGYQIGKYRIVFFFFQAFQSTKRR